MPPPMRRQPPTQQGGRPACRGGGSFDLAPPLSGQLHTAPHRTAEVSPLRWRTACGFDRLTPCKRSSNAHRCWSCIEVTCALRTMSIKRRVTIYTTHTQIHGSEGLFFWWSPFHIMSFTLPLFLLSLLSLFGLAAFLQASWLSHVHCLS